METSPLGAARLRRRLSLEEAAARARLDVEDVKSLEEARIWRFPSTAEALGAACVYATALGITEREARELAGLPERPRRLRLRWPALAAFAAACALLALFVFSPNGGGDDTSTLPAPAAAVPAQQLPERWEIQVDVFNGTGRGNAAAGYANEIAGLAYRIGAVGDARRSDYVETRVYYPPGAEAIAERLAEELGLETAALPGGDNPRRLVVIVGRRQ
jgi:hypothetical protein